jgi:sugar lactone lactonase YvrE
MTATKWRLALAACFGMITAGPTAICADEFELTGTPAVEVEVDVDVALEEATPAEEGAAAEEAVVYPTHKQTLIINVNADGLDQATLHSFCLNGDGQILAACGDGPGEIRVFNGDGEYVESWKVPVRPEAINLGSDGNVYVAGNGKLLRLDAQGKVLHQADSPHAAELLASTDALRKEIVDQSKQMAEQFNKQIEQYDKQISVLEKTIAAKEEAGEEPSKSEERRLKSFTQMKKQYEQMAEQLGAKEYTDEELDEKVKASMDYKLKVASISETGGKVYVACSAAAGYGFNVWQLDEEFANGKVVVSELRGCCGQMDVQAGKAGIVVAENSRHRVACYDKQGELAASWGKQSRSGLDGFGSCCNPMNVAFGADGSIYTAESELGRVKRFSAEGELLDLVGKVDIVPGCKKVAIAVDKTGDNVFMLDVSRNHIVKMERLAPGEKIAYSETRGESTAAATPSLGSALLKVLTGN